MTNDTTEKIRDTYNQIAEGWHRDMPDDTWWIKGTTTFLDKLTPGNTILDVGCGSGKKAAYFSERGFKVVGFDISEKMIELAQGLVPNGKFFVMDMHEVRAIKDSFTGIIMRASLLHIPRNQAASVVKNTAKLLVKGGFLYIAVKEVKETGVLEEDKQEEDFGLTFTRFFSYFTLEEVKDYMKQAGLDIAYESVTPSGRSRWIEVIGQKTL